MHLPFPQKTFWRLAVLSVGGLLLTLFIPLPANPAPETVRLPAALFMVGLGLVLLMRAIERRRRLYEAVAIELNKLRRVYHISKNMSSFDERLRVWFTELHGYLYGYLNSFANKDLSQYEFSHTDFRRLSYHIYTVPELNSVKEEVLYRDLLRTTAEIAELRQHVLETRDSRLSAYGWTVFLMSVLTFFVAVVASTPDGMVGRLVSGTVIVGALLLVDLLWEIDSLQSERYVFPQRYVENVARLELRREP